MNISTLESPFLHSFNPPPPSTSVFTCYLFLWRSFSPQTHSAQRSYSLYYLSRNFLGIFQSSHLCVPTYFVYFKNSSQQLKLSRIYCHSTQAFTYPWQLYEVVLLNLKIKNLRSSVVHWLTMVTMLTCNSSMFTPRRSHSKIPPYDPLPLAILTLNILGCVESDWKAGFRREHFLFIFSHQRVTKALAPCKPPSNVCWINEWINKWLKVCYLLIKFFFSKTRQCLLSSV